MINSAAAFALADLLRRCDRDLPRLDRRHGALRGVSRLCAPAFPASATPELSWVLNAYTVVYAALLAPAGRLADLYGRKRMFVVGVGVFLLASLGCGLSSHIALLIGSRVSAGDRRGAAASRLAVDRARRVPDRKARGRRQPLGRGRRPGRRAGAERRLLVDRAMGLAMGVLHQPSARRHFAVRGARGFTESRNPENGAPLDLGRRDAAGFRRRRARAGPDPLGNPRLVFADASSRRSASASSRSALFVPWARRIAAPAIDLTLFDNATYRFVNLATLSFGTAFAMMFFNFFLFMTEIWNYPMSKAGLAATPGPLLVVPVSILAGRFAGRFGHRPVLMTGARALRDGRPVVLPGSRPRARLPARLAARDDADRASAPAWSCRRFRPPRSPSWSPAASASAARSIRRCGRSARCWAWR